MDSIRGNAITGLAAALALAVSLPAAAQVVPTRKQATDDAYLKVQSLSLPTISADPSSGRARLVSPGQLVEPAGPTEAPGDSTGTLSPSLRAWVKSRARAMVDSGTVPDPNLIAGDVRARLAGQETSDQDIEAIAYLVMMEASKAAQEDMRQVMEQVKAQNARKAAMRDAMQAQRAAGSAASTAQAASSPQLRAICVDPPCGPRAGATKPVQPVDSTSEMGEMESLRLQMAMDRLSKMMSTLSNLLKQQSDTASSITQNLK